MDCTEMPVYSSRTTNRTSMPGTGSKSSRLVAERIMSRILKGTQRRFSYINTVTIHIELSARSGILQIIFPIVFRHPRTLDEWLDVTGMIFAKTFPPINVRTEKEQ